MIVIPANCWQTVIERFTPAAGLAENVAFLDGIPLGPEPVHGGVVTTVTLPEADRKRGGWWVDASQMSAAGQHLRVSRLVRLAQIHTHPGPGPSTASSTTRSPTRSGPGTISIVLPTHGLTHPGLADAGVHLRGDDGWRELARRGGRPAHQGRALGAGPPRAAVIRPFTRSARRWSHRRPDAGDSRAGTGRDSGSRPGGRPRSLAPIGQPDGEARRSSRLVAARPGSRIPRR